MKDEKWYCEVQAPPELHEHIEQLFNAISYKIRHADGYIEGYKYGLKKDIILCEECMYWQNDEECRWGHDETPNADDFCSYAERIENNDKS